MMPSFDTSGAIHFSTRYAKANGLKTFYRWSDLDAFTQGYVEALFASRPLERDEDQPVSLGFSDLANKALAQIIADCARRTRFYGPLAMTADMGAAFWRNRQSGRYARALAPELPFPPLKPTLGEDGKVYLSTPSDVLSCLEVGS